MEGRNTRLKHIWEKSILLHGTPCPLLALGARICDTALEKLSLEDAGSSRLVCVSEYDGCCVDAIQAGLHCTAGTKHLLYHKTGRLIFSVYDLVTGASVRICARKEIEDSVRNMADWEILSLPEEQLFRFEEAHPLTKRTLEKVTKACSAPEDGIPERDSGIQDCLGQFSKYDLIDDGLARNTRRR